MAPYHLITDHLNSQLLVRYSSHDLNNEHLNKEPLKVRNSNVSAIQMFTISIPTVLQFRHFGTGLIFTNFNIVLQQGS